MNQMILPLCTLAAIVAPVMGAENWGTDLPAALTKAAAEKKNVLILFTGSDWCPPCMALKKNILSTPEFDAYAKDKFVLVEVDLPRQKKLPEGLEEKNRALATKYAIEGFPTMLVMTPEGVVTSGMVGGRPTLKALTDEFASSDAVTKALATAATATGVEKAKALYDAYKAVPEGVRGTNVDLIEQIKALDTADTLGLNKEAAAKSAAEAEIKAIQDRLNACGEDLAAAQKVIDEELAKGTLSPQAELFAMEVNLQILMIKAETKDDIKAIQAYLYKLAEKNTENAEQIKTFADNIMTQADGILEHAKKQREEMKK